MPLDATQYTLEEMKAIVDEAAKLERKVAAHAHGTEGIKPAVRAGVDSIEHGAFLDDEAIDLMKARGTYYIPTLMAVEGGKIVLDQGGYAPLVAEKMKAAIASINNVVKKAIARGVKIGIGTDAAVYPHGRNTEEFHLLVDLGMSPLDALRAGTTVNAELLGMKGQIGTLAEGAFADVIAFPGRPAPEHQGRRARVLRHEGRDSSSPRSSGEVNPCVAAGFEPRLVGPRRERRRLPG